MRRFLWLSILTILLLLQVGLDTGLVPPPAAQEWTLRKPRGTLKVVDLGEPYVSLMQNCVEGLVTVDKDNKLAPCLAEDWRWLNDRTLEFRLKRGVVFHNGEQFNAERVGDCFSSYVK